MRVRNANMTLFGVFVMLVVVGLFVGLMLVGFDNMHLKEVRGDLTQIEKYKSATEAFRQKYDYLPGDMPAALVMQLNFTPRDGSEGRGDGNGLVEGYTYIGNHVENRSQTGEPFFFWEDLSSAILIKGVFNTARDAEPGTTITDATDYLPNAKMENDNRIYVYSDNNANYYGISHVIQIDANTGTLTSKPGLSVKQAYEIDSKIDDGIPTTGKVVAKYVSDGVITAPTKPGSSPDSCYDTTTGHYSLESNGGRNVNCALSFMF